MAKSSRKKLTDKVRRAILEQAILPEQLGRNEYDLVNPAEIDSGLPQTLVPINRTQWAIERYHHRGQIDERQFDAGVKFRKLSEHAAILPSVTGGYQQNYNPRGGGWRQGDISDRVAEARRQWNAILAALPPRIADIAVDAICFDASPARFGRGSRPDITGMAYIRLCLDVLADHYRL